MPRIESSREGAGILRQQLLPPFNRPLCCLLAERFSATADPRPIQFSLNFLPVLFPRPSGRERSRHKARRAAPPLAKALLLRTCPPLGAVCSMLQR